MFADMIRSVNTEHEVYFLLTSYIEAVRYCDQLHCCVPEPIVRLPLNGETDIRERFEQLMIELDNASKRLDDNSCTVIREGVHVFGTALGRLRVLDIPRHVPQSVAAAGLDARAA